MATLIKSRGVWASDIFSIAKLSKRFALTVVLSMVAVNAQAVVMNYNPTFTTQDQSIWNEGAATILDQSKFLGVQWDN